MIRILKLPKSLRVLLAPALMTIALVAVTAGPDTTLAVDYPPDPYPTPTPVTTPTPLATPMSLPIETRASISLGAYLVDPSGRTLYTLSSDPANSSTCLDQCAAAWPPVIVGQGGTATAGPGVNGAVSTLTRSDGSTQISHDGRALYFFSGDTASGDTNGEGIVSFGGSWHVARPTKVEAPKLGCVRIVGGVWNPPGNDNHPPALNVESVRIKNACATTKTLTGWRILDYHGAHVYRFPKGFSIRPGVTATVFSGRGNRTATRLYWGRTSGEVWGNAFPERAYLRDSTGKTVSTFTLYPY